MQRTAQNVYNIDLFLRCLYQYWHAGGYRVMVAKKCYDLLRVVVLACTFTVLLFCIDYASLWNNASNNNNNTTAAPLKIMQQTNFTTVSEHVAVDDQPQSLFVAPSAGILCVVWIIGCTIKVLYETVKTWKAVRQCADIQRFFHNQLQFDDDDAIYWSSWSMVCERLRSLQLRAKQNDSNTNLFEAAAATTATTTSVSPTHSAQQHFEKQMASKNYMTTTTQSSSGDSDDNECDKKSSDDNTRNMPRQDEKVDEETVSAELSNDEISSMIMRRENYWRAMFADRVLAFSVQNVNHTQVNTEERSNETQNRDNPQRDLFDNRKMRDINAQQAATTTTLSPLFSSSADDSDRLFAMYDHPDKVKPVNGFAQTSNSVNSSQHGLSAESAFGSENRDGNFFAQDTLESLLTLNDNSQMSWQDFGFNGLQYLWQQYVKPVFVTSCEDWQGVVFEKPIMTQTLQWCITYSLYAYAIDSQTGALKHELAHFVHTASSYAEREERRNRLSRDYTAAQEWHRAHVSKPLVDKLAWRFRVMALLGALLSPLVFVFVILSFFFEHGDQVKRTPGASLGAREWTTEAHWTFRRYNELPHQYEERLAQAAPLAQQFVETFPFRTQSIIGRSMTFFCGALLFLLLLIGALGDDEALLHANFLFSRSGLWWLTTLSIVVAATRSMVATQATSDMESRIRNKHDGPHLVPQHLCKKVAQITGHYPYMWIGREHTELVRAEFCCLYESRWLTYMREIASIFYTPYVMWFVFPPKADQFLNFFVERTEKRDKIGHVCAREHTDAINASEII